MPLLSEHSEHHASCELNDRLRDAHAVTADLMSEIIGETCRRFPSVGQAEKTARLERLIGSGAWTDAVLALIDLELPQWQVRRIAYDEGEWHCALSRQRELPEWLDQAIETSHANLTLAIVNAYIETLRQIEASREPSRPSVPQTRGDQFEPVCCDNFA